MNYVNNHFLKLITSVSSVTILVQYALVQGKTNASLVKGFISYKILHVNPVILVVACVKILLIIVKIVHRITN